VSSCTNVSAAGDIDGLETSFSTQMTDQYLFVSDTKVE
jgi:hypothetical protein